MCSWKRWIVQTVCGDDVQLGLAAGAGGRTWSATLAILRRGQTGLRRVAIAERDQE